MPKVKQLIHCRTKKSLVIDGTVAIVGSSDLLGGSTFGEEIDKHDHVFRFNLASLDEQYRTAIGSKADFYLLSQNITTLKYPHPEPSQSHFKNICRNSKIICYPGHTKNILKFNKRPYLMAHNDEYINRVEEINHIFYQLLGHMKWAFSNQHHPRNGIKLISCLLPAGIKPDLYGFDLADRGNNSHYFDDEFQKETPERGHKPSVEFQLLKELEAKDLIRVY